MMVKHYGRNRTKSTSLNEQKDLAPKHKTSAHTTTNEQQKLTKLTTEKPRDLSHLMRKLDLGEEDREVLEKLSSREGTDYEDTTSENNVKNEIGPISKYVDRVKSEDMIMNEADPDYYYWFNITCRRFL